MTRMESRSEEEQILRDGFRTEGVLHRLRQAASSPLGVALRGQGRRPAVRHGEVFSSKRAEQDLNLDGGADVWISHHHLCCVSPMILRLIGRWALSSTD